MQTSTQEKTNALNQLDNILISSLVIDGSFSTSFAVSELLEERGLMCFNSPSFENGIALCGFDYYIYYCAQNPRLVYEEASFICES
jgi:hypothetical protein